VEKTIAICLACVLLITSGYAAYWAIRNRGREIGGQEAALEASMLKTGQGSLELKTVTPVGGNVGRAPAAVGGALTVAGAPAVGGFWAIGEYGTGRGPQVGRGDRVRGRARAVGERQVGGLWSPAYWSSACVAPAVEAAQVRGAKISNSSSGAPPVDPSQTAGAVNSSGASISSATGATPLAGPATETATAPIASPSTETATALPDASDATSSPSANSHVQFTEEILSPGRSKDLGVFQNFC